MAMMLKIAMALTMDTTAEELKCVKDLSRQHSLPVTSISTSLYGDKLGGPGRDRRDQARVLLEKQLEYAEALGADGVLVVPGGIIDAVNHAISERGDVLDSASQKLGSIRSQMKVARERLFTRLGRYLNDPATAVVLQESLITQRNGRYVIPLRAEFKGRIKSEPTLGTTQKGKAAFYAKVEQRHWDYEDDGTYTRLPNTYHDLVAYKGVAVRAYKQLAKNDFFIAEGRMEDYQSKSTGETKQRFVATALGHDMARTTYEVDRTPRREQAQRPTVERDAAQQSAGSGVPEQPERQVAQQQTPAAFAAPEYRPDRQSPDMGL